MRRLIAALALLGLASPTGPAAAQSAISPGYWETINEVISPFPTRKTERRCIRPADVAKFMQGPSNHIYTCTYPVREIGAGKIRLRGSCASKNSAPVPITGDGVFTGDSLRMDATVKARFGGLSIPVHARTTGKRLDEPCPAEPAPAP